MEVAKVAGSVKDAALEFASKNTSLVALGGAGIAGAGALAIGSSKRNSDKIDSKIDRLERKQDRREATGSNLMVAGAIATAGVSGYGLSKLLSKSV